MASIAALFTAATLQFHLPPGLLESVCYVESNHNVAAIHENDGGSDSLGICQMKLKTARWLGFKGTKADLLKPEVNIHYAAMYLARNHKRYHSYSRAVIAYNRGNASGLTSSKYQSKVYAQWRQINE